MFGSFNWTGVSVIFLFITVVFLTYIPSTTIPSTSGRAGIAVMNAVMMLMLLLSSIFHVLIGPF